MSARASIRIALFSRILLDARRSFGLPDSIVDARMPTVYAAESYDPTLAKKNGVSHVEVGGSHYTLWSDERDDHDHGLTPWRSWSTSDLAEFVRHFFSDVLHGEFATYPIILTTMLSGSLMQATAEGSIEDWYRKRELVREQLLLRLERYLAGFRYRLLKFLISHVG